MCSKEVFFYNLTILSTLLYSFYFVLNSWHCHALGSGEDPTTSTLNMLEYRTHNNLNCASIVLLLNFGTQVRVNL